MGFDNHCVIASGVAFDQGGGSGHQGGPNQPKVSPPKDEISSWRQLLSNFDTFTNEVPKAAFWSILGQPVFWGVAQRFVWGRKRFASAVIHSLGLGCPPLTRSGHLRLPVCPTSGGGAPVSEDPVAGHPPSWASPPPCGSVPAGPGPHRGPRPARGGGGPGQPPARHSGRPAGAAGRARQPAGDGGGRVGAAAAAWVSSGGGRRRCGVWRRFALAARRGFGKAGGTSEVSAKLSAKEFPPIFFLANGKKESSKTTRSSA